MLDDFDFVNGTDGTRWMRIISGLVGVVLGAGIGYLYSYIAEVSGLMTVGYAVAGAAIGGFFGALFSFYVILALVVVLVVGGVFVFQFVFGGR